MMFTRTWTRTLFSAAAFGLLTVSALAQNHVEPPFFAEKVSKKELPPLAERLPTPPIVVSPEGGRAGEYGGDMVTLVPRARDIRYISTWSYTRLVGYDRKLQLQPDLLEKVE